MVIGSVLVLSALGLFLYNAQEQKQGGDAVDVLMPQLVEAIHDRQDDQIQEPATEDDPQIIVTQPREEKLPVVEIDGYGYIGFVSIPALGVELPVMADWSYPQLKISPCRFTGELYSDDLVIMAHNYDRHFGSLKDLRVGDTVTFTDMDGVSTLYAVAALDLLEPTDVEELTAGDFDLTLFTCTYGGKSRVTVRCDRVDD